MMANNILLTPHDRDISSSAFMQFVRFTQDPNNNNAPKKSVDNINFQFPPKVLSDSRRGNWTESQAAGNAPIASLQYSDPRVISLQITYILDGDWDKTEIKRNIQIMRGYFQQYVFDNVGRFESLIVSLKLWSIGGNDPMTFRLKNVDVKYSETMIGIKDDAFPYRSDITLDLSTWTKETSGGLEGLPATLPVEWY